MKRFFEAILLLQFIALPTFAQNPYTAILRLGVMDTVTNPDEWAVRVYLDVFDAEHNYIQVNDNINYNVDLCDGHGWRLQPEHANGALWDGMKIKTFRGCSACTFQTFLLSAERVINGYTVLAEVQLPDEATGSIVLKKPVSINQILYSGNPFGYVGLWIDNTFLNYPSGASIAFFPNSYHTFRANQDLAGMSEEKYNNWNYLPNVVNHQQFQILSNLNNLTGRFGPVFQATIQAQLIEGGSPGGTIDFTDPWFIDFDETPYGMRNRGLSAIPHPVDYAEYNIGINSVHKGVFLSQSFAGGNYYSVGAPNPNYINNFTAHFDSWAPGGNVTYQNAANAQTGVVFTASGATATAWYKAHLGSSASNATGSNSQRLVACIESAPDRYYMAYPSVGELWRTQSLDAGATWETDTKFTNSSGTTSAPSVALWREPADPPIMHLFTAYRQQVGNNYQIRFTDALATPLASAPVSQIDIPTSIDTRPVIALLNDEGYKTLWAFWQSIYGIHYNYAEWSGSTWYWLGEEYGGLAANTRNPSISSPDLNAQTTNWYLTYDNANNVLITDYRGTFYDTAIPASVSPTSYSSQVCADNRSGEQVHVVWEAYGGEEPGTDRGDSWEGDAAIQQRRVMYQNCDGSQWLPAHEFRGYYSSTNYYRPTISNLANGHLAWAWDNGSSTYKALSTNSGTSWAVTEVYNNTMQPNLAISASEGPIGSTRFVSTSTTGAPYRLNLGAATTGPLAGPQASILPEQYSRRVVVARKPPQRTGRFHHSMTPDGQFDRDSSSYLSVELSPVSLKMRDGSVVSVDFAAVGDSVRDERSIWQLLVSLPVTLPSGIDSIIIDGETDALSPHGLAGTELGLSFDLVDADRGTLLKRIGTERIFTSNGRGALVRREKLAGVAGSRVFIRPSVRGFAGRSANLVSTLVHVHTLLMDSTSNPTSPLAKAGENPTTVPTAFALHQNYPNPFNPTTEIRFDLPDAGNVSLVVYDVLGREVAELANGYREAGYHSATWNASDRASGVYFARFSVINVEGKMAYSKVRKLLLVK